MLIGQRVCWLVPGKTGVVTAYHQLTQTVDIQFEDADRSARGHVPITEVVSVEQGTVDLPSTAPKQSSSTPPAITSHERFGRPSLG